MSYTERAVPVAVSPALSLAGVASPTLVSTTVRIAAGSSADAGDVLGVSLAMTGDLVDGTAIHVHYDAANGTLLLSGTDTTLATSKVQPQFALHGPKRSIVARLTESTDVRRCCRTSQSYLFPPTGRSRDPSDHNQGQVL
jgi:hypothetical protein